MDAYWLEIIWIGFKILGLITLNHPRNEDGLFASKRVGEHDDVEIVEAEGVLWGLQLCRDGGFHKIQVEIDCLPLMTKLKQGSFLIGELGFLLMVITALHCTSQVFRGV